MGKCLLIKPCGLTTVLTETLTWTGTRESIYYTRALNVIQSILALFVMINSFKFFHPPVLLLYNENTGVKELSNQTSKLAPSFQYLNLLKNCKSGSEC